MIWACDKVCSQLSSFFYLQRKIESTSSHNEKYTRNRNPRIRVGWRHFKNGSFKQVFYKDGGGVREVPLPSLDLDVKAVIQQAKEVIFPTGECKYGDVDQMELCLGDYAGKKLTNFDIHGDDNQLMLWKIFASTWAPSFKMHILLNDSREDYLLNWYFQ